MPGVGVGEEMSTHLAQDLEMPVQQLGCQKSPPTLHLFGKGGRWAAPFTNRSKSALGQGHTEMAQGYTCCQGISRTKKGKKISRAEHLRER